MTNSQSNTIQTDVAQLLQILKIILFCRSSGTWRIKLHEDFVSHKQNQIHPSYLHSHNFILPLIKKQNNKQQPTHTATATTALLCSIPTYLHFQPCPQPRTPVPERILLLPPSNLPRLERPSSNLIPWIGLASPRPLWLRPLTSPTINLASSRPLQKPTTKMMTLMMMLTAPLLQASGTSCLSRQAQGPSWTM